MFFEISGDVLPPPLQVHDFAVLSALIVAMREGRPVHVEGPVTEALIRGLEEFQEAWALWRTKYTPVRITADQIVPVETPSTRRGMFAFSGGVDGTFALLRHHKARAGLRTARPIGAMLVHGFDIPLGEQQAFDRARANVADVIGALGLPLAVVRTNWRSEACKVWPQEYLAGLSACLHQFRGLANVGVLGAGEDYAHFEPPVGSNNPITNHLLSGGGFEIHTEGGGFTRTQRVAPHQRLSGDRGQAQGVLGRPADRRQLRALREVHPHQAQLHGDQRARRSASMAVPRPMRRSSASRRASPCSSPCCARC